MGKLLFMFVLGHGHINVCLSVAKQLIYKYPEHEIYFCVENEEFFKKVSKSCHLFKPILMDKSYPMDDEEDQEEFRKSFYKTGLEKFIENHEIIGQLQDFYINDQAIFEKVIDQVNPDVIILDQLFNLPFVENKNIPWGLIVSTNPLYAQNLPNYPPGFSGLSSDPQKDGHLWNEYRNQRKCLKTFEKRKKWFKDCNVELDDKDEEIFLRGSNYLNLYVYPKYADYFSSEKLGNWYSTSHCILDEEIENRLRQNAQNASNFVKYPGKQLLSSEFLAKPGKLILFSLGTIVSDHVKVMNEFLDIIAPIPHKFIVSAGKSFDKIKFPENCVGAPFLDQKELYSIVDLCISHGGNNTFCELFYLYKKPFILIPFFGDQPDNATRLEDLNLGKSISINDVSRETLENAIEQVTTDEGMKRRMEEAAKLSKADKRMEKFIDELHLHLKKQKK